MLISLCSCCDKGTCRRGRTAVGYVVSLLGLELCHLRWPGWKQAFLLAPGAAKHMASQGVC